MLQVHDVPRLVSRARLRLDHVGKSELLLYPERALRLNESAAAIVRLCDGRRDVASIVDALADTSGLLHVARNRLESDVLTLLNALDSRGLLVRDEER